MRNLLVAALAVALIFTCAPPGDAQMSTAPVVLGTPTTVTASGVSATLSPIGVQSVCTFDLTGTWSGSFTVEGVGSGGSHGAPLRPFHAIASDGTDVGSELTADDVYRVQCGGLQMLRVRSHDWVSGSAVVYPVATIGSISKVGGAGGGVSSIIADSPLLASTPTGDVELSLNNDMRDLGPPIFGGANIVTAQTSGSTGCTATGDAFSLMHISGSSAHFDFCISGDNGGLEVDHHNGSGSHPLFTFSSTALGASSALCTTADTIPAITTTGCAGGSAALPIFDGATKFLWRGTGTGASNIAMGIGDLAFNTTGAQNVAIGDGALAANTTNGQNVAVGYQALNSTSTSGDQNTAIGATALANLTTNSSNVAVGYQSQTTSIDGGWNTSVGTGSLLDLNHGHGNACFGYLSCAALDINDEDVGIGAWALRDFTSTTQHSYNTAIGSHALDNSGGSTGIQNTAVGYSAGQLITSGGSNVILGFAADVPNPTASHQMSLGNAIYCTGVDGTGLTISAASCGVGVQAPAHNWDVAGSFAYMTDGNNHQNSCAGRTGLPCIGFMSCTNGSAGATCDPGGQAVPAYARCTATMATTASAAGGVLVIVDGANNPGSGGIFHPQFEASATWTGTVSAYFNCV